LAAEVQLLVNVRTFVLKLLFYSISTWRDPAINDVEGFKHLEQFMDQMGLSMEEKYNLFQVVAAVLHLGNEGNTSDRKGLVIY